MAEAIKFGLVTFFSERAESRTPLDDYFFPLAVYSTSLKALMSILYCIQVLTSKYIVSDLAYMEELV